MMDRHLLRYFLAVVDTGSFSRAAALCRVSQPTISSGIARLEAVTGQVLFQRSNRRVELTPAGARLVAHARRIESEFIAAQRSISDVAPASLIRIGLASTIAPALSEQVVARCLAAGGTRIEIVERRPGELAALLDRGRVDVILGPREPDADRSHVDLFEEPFVLVMSATHRLAAAELISCDELVDEPMLVRRQCEALSQVSNFFTARGIRPFMAARSASEERVAGYVRAGLGMTVMPESLVGQGLAARPLVGLDLARKVSLTFDPAGEARLIRSGTVDAIRKAVRDVMRRVGGQASDRVRPDAL